MEILYPVSILNFLSSSWCNSALRNSFCLNWTITERVVMLCRFFKIAAIQSPVFFCILVLWHLAFRKANSYFRIKFWPGISIHGRDIITSGFWKQTDAILKFYFRFRFRPFYCHRHVILHWPTKCYANRTIADGVITSYWFCKMAAIASRFMAQTTCFRARKCLLGVTTIDDVIWEKYAPKTN